MYYFALRNYGYDLITKQGNLGRRHLPAHVGRTVWAAGSADSNGLREGARYYLDRRILLGIGLEASTVNYFDQVYRGGLGSGMEP